MAKFVRGNAIVCQATFAATDGSGATPSAAQALLTYTTVAGAQATDTVPMTLSAGKWSGSWDSTVAQACNVDWVIKSSGGLQAATQGTFELIANRAAAQ